MHPNDTPGHRLGHLVPDPAGSGKLPPTQWDIQLSLPQAATVPGVSSRPIRAPRPARLKGRHNSPG